MNTRAAAAQILSSCQRQYFNYEQKIADTADRLHFSQKDRDFLYILVKGVILYRDYLDHVIGMILKSPIKRLENIVLNLLRVGTFQHLILETPLYATTNETVRAAKDLNKFRAVGLINAALRHLPSKEELEIHFRQLPENESLAIRYSHPQWLIDRWISEYGQKNTEQIAEFNNSYQEIYFRHNPVRISWENLQDRLLEEKYSIDIASSEPVTFFSVDKPGVLLKSDMFKRGFLSVQDISQSPAVRLLNPKSGETIVDACAAPGGKTGFIAQLAGASGKIHAYDISQGKVRLLKNEIFRLGIDFVNYGVADARTNSFPMADKILLDVPCSGTGVLARRADLRWNRKREDIEKLLDIQRQILANTAHYCKPGGIIVYSTCSIEPEENWSNIEWFLQSHPVFKIESADRFIENKWCNKNGTVAILPHVHRQTGSFAVRLVNKG